jgi:hypothetical protein
VVDDIVDTNSGTDILSDCCGKKKTIETELFYLDDFYSIFQSFNFGNGQASPKQNGHLLPENGEEGWDGVNWTCFKAGQEGVT